MNKNKSQKQSLCNCKLCLRAKKIDELIKRKNFELLAKYTRELCCLLINIETDVEHYRLILNGRWPNSLKILESALQKAKTYNE